MIFLLAVITMLGLMGYWSKQWWDQTTKDIISSAFVRYLGKAFVIVLPLLILEGLVWTSFVIVPAGH